MVNDTKFEVKKMFEVVYMQRGRFGHRPRNDPNYYGGRYPFIQTGNVVEASRTNQPIKFTQTLNELGLSTSRLFDPGVLIITIAANIADTAILTYKACFPDSLVALTPKSDINIYYLNIYIRLIKDYIERLAPQSAQKNINLKQLSPIPIIVPPPKIQSKIIEIMDKAYVIKQQKEKEAGELLDSISDYFLGQLGIVMPEVEESTLEKRMSYVNSNDVIGGRFDPKKYTAKYKNIFHAIKSSICDKKNLRQVIKDDITGNWGLDETVEDKNLIKCLTIRATEFDNRYNLNLDNNRVKYRKYTFRTYEKMSITIGDILVEKSGGSEDQPVGRVAIIDKESLENNILAFSNFIHKIVANDEFVRSDYLYEYLTLMHNIKVTEVMQNQTNGIRNLIMNEYLNQTILLPTKEKQAEIASYIVSIKEQARQLETEAISILEQAKKEVETILLGGETHEA